MRRRLLAPLSLAVAASAALIALAALGTPAAGAAPSTAPTGDRRVSVTGDVVVAEGETVDGPVVSIDGNARIDGVVTGDVLVGSGRLTVNGRVTGDVLVVHRDVRVTGRVGGDVVAVDGRVVVVDGATVGGDVVSRRAPRVAAGTVRGDVKRLDLEGLFTGFLIVVLAYLWIAVTVSVALLGLAFVLLFPRAADASAIAARRVGPSFAWGALVGIVGPIVGVAVLATVIGIPLGAGILAALTVLAPLGYVTTSLALGRTMVKGDSTGSRVGAFFAGFGILRAVALVPGLGVLVWLVACIDGLGAVTIAAWHAGNRGGTSDAGAVIGASTPPPEAGGPAADDEHGASAVAWRPSAASDADTGSGAHPNEGGAGEGT